MKNSLKIRQIIIDYLVHFKLRIATNNNLGLYDANKLSQDFLASLLNIINLESDTEYIDLDKIKANYPAIDLGCQNVKIAYQITSQNDTSKIYNTISSFKKMYFDTGEFETIRFIILNDINWSKQQWENIEERYADLGLKFDNKSVLSIEELEKELSLKDESTLERFLEELKKEFGEIEHSAKELKEENRKISKKNVEIEKQKHDVKIFEKIEGLFPEKHVLDVVENVGITKRINSKHYDLFNSYRDFAKLESNKFLNKNISITFTEFITRLNEFESYCASNMFPIKNYPIIKFTNMEGDERTLNYFGFTDYFPQMGDYNEYENKINKKNRALVRISLDVTEKYNLFRASVKENLFV